MNTLALAPFFPFFPVLAVAAVVAAVFAVAAVFVADLAAAEVDSAAPAVADAVRSMFKRASMAKLLAPTGKLWHWQRRQLVDPSRCLPFGP